jgi:hypothetical protein
MAQTSDGQFGLIYGCLRDNSCNVHEINAIRPIQGDLCTADCGWLAKVWRIGVIFQFDVFLSSNRWRLVFEIHQTDAL